jgi:maltose O-acetyltransferase
LEDGVYVGAGAVLLPKMRIGNNAVIAAGAVVTRDVASRTMVAGNPAKIIREGIAGYRDIGV